jgi:hypothetical protein
VFSHNTRAGLKSFARFGLGTKQNEMPDAPLAGKVAADVRRLGLGARRKQPRNRGCYITAEDAPQKTAGIAPAVLKTSEA